MDYRQLGASGLRVSTITLGTMGFAGTGWAKPVGNLDVEGARLGAVPVVEERVPVTATRG